MDAVDDEPAPLIPGDVDRNGEIRVVRPGMLSAVALGLAQDVSRPQPEGMPVVPPEGQVEDPLEVPHGHQLDRPVAPAHAVVREVDQPGLHLGRRAFVGDRPGIVHGRSIPTLSDGRGRPCAAPRLADGLTTLARVNVLVVGSGAREHALAWRLAQAPSVEELHAAPGNPGMARLAHCHPVRADDAEAVLGLARALDAQLVVIGPEAPLVAGLADELRRAGISVFGPSAAAARIEGSKAFAKEVMTAAGVPTAMRLDAPRAPCVLKVDGLAAGKGVVVCRSEDDVVAGLAALADQGPLLVEELLEGEEVSLFAICDGRDAVALPAAQDFKRAYDGDDGPNTGGMGAYAPVAQVSETEAAQLLDLVHRPVLDELARRGAPFVGLLYAGLMLTDGGPRVLEFNCRFGDPETQAVLPARRG